MKWTYQIQEFLGSFRYKWQSNGRDILRCSGGHDEWILMKEEGMRSIRKRSSFDDEQRSFNCLQRECWQQ